MNKKGFSLIEIIFSLVIVSLLIGVAITKFDTSLHNVHIIQIRSDVLQIRSAIHNYKNTMILKNELASFTSLEETGQKLFEKILQNPLQSTPQKAGSWESDEENIYKVFLTPTEFVTFTFNPKNYSFQCDQKDSLCTQLEL